jgi:hypothetical protein
MRQRDRLKLDINTVIKRSGNSHYKLRPKPCWPTHVHKNLFVKKFTWCNCMHFVEQNHKMSKNNLKVLFVSTQTMLTNPFAFYKFMWDFRKWKYQIKSTKPDKKTFKLPSRIWMNLACFCHHNNWAKWSVQLTASQRDK